MKKLIALLTTALLMSSAIFAGTMNERLVEIRVDAPFDVSNNAFAILDLFQSEELVIDLGEIANSMPEEGWTIRSNMSPFASLNVNVAGVHVGVDIGADLYGSFNLDKSIFNFLAFGNQLNETVTIQPTIYSEFFVDVTANIGLELSGMNVKISPSLFVPFFSVNSDNTYVKFQNTSDGDFIASMSGSIDMYSQFALDETGNNLNMANVSTDNGDAELLSNDALCKYLSVSGIDLAGSVEVPLYFFDGLSFGASVRCPIVPGKLSTKTSFSAAHEYKTSISDLIQDAIDSTKNTEEEQESETTAADEESDSIIDLTDFDYTYYSEETVYKINRPFKFMGYATFQPFGEFITAKAGLGFGIRSPLSENAKVYGEYYLGGGVSVLGGLLSAYLSTEYTNQIFLHQASIAFSVRAFELDVGIGTEGPNFAKSFNLSGIHAYVGFAVGI